jgi:putative ABC transport system ATP-binding protein
MIETRDLTRRFGSVTALDRVTLSVPRGEWVAVTGPSGSGKTTLLNILAGLDRPSAGWARVGEVEISALSPRQLARYRQRSVGLVFQHFHLMPHLTALENVMLAQHVHSLADRPQAEAALGRVGLGDRMSHLPRELSGGEQQRVAIARALINQPPLLLADEPTGNLDADSEVVVMDLLAQHHRQGGTVVLVTHAAALAARADREIRLDHGRRVEPVQPPTLLDAPADDEGEGEPMAVGRPA